LINECFLHCPGIGPKTENRLKEKGYRNWDDCLDNREGIPLSGRKRESFINEIERSSLALENEEIDFFIERYPAKEHWRILGRYYKNATFFDIETTGLSWHYNHASVISAYQNGRLFTFVHGENLDDFLLLVDDSEMLVTFNGNCFDIPFLEKTFNIPALDCPHVDLRWVAYHRGYRGGLKLIERDMGIFRPHEISEVDGFEAVDLYYRWQSGDQGAREKLLSYCNADVLSTYMVAGRLLNECGIEVEEADPDLLFDMV